MTAYLRIKNLEKYQHYKDRNPPWIKLHRAILTSRTWVALDDASRVLAVACMLLASDTGNQIPLDHAYIKRVCYLNSDPDFAPLIEADFIEIIEDTESSQADASKVLAKCTTETETETETEKEAPPPLPKGTYKRKAVSLVPSVENLFLQGWQAERAGDEELGSQTASLKDKEAILQTLTDIYEVADKHGFKSKDGEDVPPDRWGRYFWRWMADNVRPKSDDPKHSNCGYACKTEGAAFKASLKNGWRPRNVA